MNLLSDFDRLVEFGIQMSVIVGLIAGLAAWLKRSINQGMVTEEKLEESLEKAKTYTDEKIAAHKEQTQKDDAQDKKWLNTLQDKVEANGKNIYKVAGKVGVDL